MDDDNSLVFGGMAKNCEIQVKKVVEYLEYCRQVFKTTTRTSSTDSYLFKLKRLAWTGVPLKNRGVIWKVCSGYLPITYLIECEENQTYLEHQQVYRNLAQQYANSVNNVDESTLQQIRIDIPRTHPANKIFTECKTIIEMFTRILYIWAARHPASGYVQGLNDLILPIFMVYVYEHLDEQKKVNSETINKISKKVLGSIECDVYFTLTQILDNLQDNYTWDQPGIQTKVSKIEKLVQLAAPRLFEHLHSNNVHFMQFTLRWINNLLVRELPINCVIRLWDVYFCEESGFDKFHLFVCGALLIRHASKIFLMRDFQEITFFLQHLPTFDWDEDMINVLVAEAFQLQVIYAGLL